VTRRERSERRVGSQLPRLCQQPRRAVASAGDDAIEFAESIGWDDDAGRGFYVLDEWQKFCIRGILSEDENARLCAEISLLIVPRQNGKGAILEVIELYAMFVLELPLVLHSAHLGETSADHMDRLWSAISSDPELFAQCKQVLAKGYEAIEFRPVDQDTGEARRRDNGAVVVCEIRFRTRSKKGGRGGSPQMVVFDEALFLTSQQVSAMLPSLSAQTMGDDAPLLIYASSAPIAESARLHMLRSQILRGELPDAFMAEWSVELPDGDRAQALRSLISVDSVYDANPGAGTRISADWCVHTELSGMDLEDWCIERLGVVFTADGDTGVLPANRWAACRDMQSFVDDGRIALSVGKNGSSAAICLVGEREDGALHIEVVRHQTGTDWISEAALAGTDQFGPLVVDPKTETARVLVRLRAAGVPIEEVETAEVIRRSVAFQDDVMNCRVRHLDQPELNGAVTGADIRPVGESWLFSAKASNVDIQPLLAAVLAAGAARAPKEELVPLISFSR
jgi:hypothetical protein